MTRRTTPAQTIGPFFHHALPIDKGELLVAADDPRAIRIEGRVVDGDGAGVGDALIEIWQADPDGHYAHPEDPAAAAFHGFGRTPTDKDGRFHFLTVKPGQVPGLGNAAQAPHIAVTVFARGLLNRLVTRLYFSDEAANEIDPVLASIDDDQRRSTLIAERQAGDGAPVYRFDIRLQGDGETVFFEV